jgi:hypothetical protein
LKSAAAVQAGLAWFFTDTLTDLYRAGYAAGLYVSGTSKPAGENQQDGPDGALPGEDGPPKEDGPLKEDLAGPDSASETPLSSEDSGEVSDGEALFFCGSLEIREQGAFERGLSEQGFLRLSRYIYPSSDYSPDGRGRIALIRGRGERYAEVFPGSEFRAPPLLLFSWMDPAFAPDETVLIFDDSPWAQLIPALRMLKEGESRGLIPSEIRVLNQKDRFSMLKKLKTLIFLEF